MAVEERIEDLDGCVLGKVKVVAGGGSGKDIGLVPGNGVTGFNGVLGDGGVVGIQGTIRGYKLICGGLVLSDAFEYGR